MDAVETSLLRVRSEENGSENEIGDISGRIGQEALLGWRAVDLFALFTLPGNSSLEVGGTAIEVSGAFSNIVGFSFMISSSCWFDEPMSVSDGIPNRFTHVGKSVGKVNRVFDALVGSLICLSSESDA